MTNPNFIIELTDTQVKMIQAALSIVRPTGGGSDVNTLYEHIKAFTGVGAPALLELHYANNVVRDYLDSFDKPAA